MKQFTTKCLKRYASLAFVIVAILAIVLGSFLYLNSQPLYQGKVESLNVGVSNVEPSFLIYVAQYQKYFAANGLNVSIIQYDSGLSIANSLLKGELDIGASSEFVFAGKIMGNASIRTVGVIDRFFNEYLVARTDKGINSILDLTSKTIGVPLGTSTEFHLVRFLELNSMSLSQVKLVNYPSTQIPLALSNGTVDAVIAWQPHINTIKSLLPNATVMWSAQNQQATYWTAYCSNNWSLTHSEIIIRFLNALSQAENYVNNNLNESQTIMKNLGSFSDEYIQEVWSNHKYSLSLDQSFVATMRDESRWQISNNRTNATSVPNFIDYIYFGGLEAVQPESINIVR
jgi:ABC-type nitrate/sulfonate/bicarbonate transport system substrate-binding protein